MKVTIPEQLKADMPQTIWGKILAATPVVMTVIATMLAGLSSSEMTRAQYDRSLGAQLQSKAGDQWNYFQAKKLRGAIQRNSIELLRVTADVHPADADALQRVAGPASVALDAMNRALAAGNQTPTFDAGIKAALDAVAASKPDSEVNALLKDVSNPSLAAALETAKDNARKFDADISAASPGLDELEKKLGSGDKALLHDFTATRMNLSASRYDTEARLNQTVANIYELQVRKANTSAEHHHARSQRFFYGMLAAQMAVIIATFAMAAKARNLLWSIAAVAGLVAVALAVYVYIYV
jgi:hypothetical protein